MNIISWYLSLSAVAKKAWAIGCLILGVIFSVVGVIGFLVFKASGLMVLIVIGTPMAVLGSPYWFEKWIVYDRLWNWLLDGDFEETVSSRLGKWHFFDHPPVFTGRLFFLNQLISLWLDQVDKDHIKTSIMPSAGVPVADHLVAKLNSVEGSLYHLE